MVKMTEEEKQRRKAEREAKRAAEIREYVEREVAKDPPLPKDDYSRR